MRLITVLIGLVLVAGCSSSGSSVQSRLQSAVTSGATSFDFAADQKFAWDRMYVFDCYSDQTLVETALGFEWPDFRRTSIESSDSVVLVVFVKQNSVVYSYEQPQSVELGWLANGEGYARTEATFSIIRVGGKPQLKPPTGPGVANDSPSK